MNKSYEPQESEIRTAIAAPPGLVTVRPAPALEHGYVKPRLSIVGNILDITLGGSPGSGDSGNTTLEKPPGSPIVAPDLSGEGSGFSAPDSSGPSSSGQSDSGGSDQGSSGEGSGFFTP